MRARILILITLLTSQLALAYDHDACKKDLGSMFSDDGAQFFTWLTAPFEWSSEFTSSYGGCAAIGLRERRDMFLLSNTDAVILDSARGQGEYVVALAALSGCRDLDSAKKFSQAVQRNLHGVYFEKDAPADSRVIEQRLDRLIESEPELRGKCGLRS
jgi:hypothetical protein